MASNVSSLTPSSQLQITGLASGLDTNSIVSQLMAINSRPLANLQSQVSRDQARNSALTSVQTALQGLVTSAQGLSSTALFQNSQTVSSTNAAVVSAVATGSVGAVVGGYQIGVTAMASASQQTFSFASQSAPNTISVNHQVVAAGGTTTTVASSYNLAANASAQDLVNAVNADSSGTVWGTVVNGNIVFSDRTTGSNSSFSISGTGVTAQGAATPGQDAQYTLNGTSKTSHSNSVTDAIPGVTVTLSGVTSAGSPVTVNVGAPSVSTDAITKAVQSFISTYNSALQTVGTQLTTAPSTANPTAGTLYQDPGLNDLVTNMRQAMYTGGSGLPTGMASMLDIGVSTGSASGSATPAAGAISGQLSLDTSALTQAIQKNPSGVTAVLKSWSQNFANAVNSVAGVGGTISSRLSGNQTEITHLNSQISSMQSSLADQQSQLTQMFARLEGALSQNQSTANWLTSQLAALPTKF